MQMQMPEPTEKSAAVSLKNSEEKDYKTVGKCS